MKSIETSGKTVEDAVKAGLKEMNCDTGDVVIDVLDYGSPGLFGMFGRLAKVRLTEKEKDDALDLDMPVFSLNAQPERKPEKKPQIRPVPPKQDKPAPVAAEKPAPVAAEKPAPVVVEKPAPVAVEKPAPVVNKPMPAQERPPRPPRPPRERPPRRPVSEREERPTPPPATFEDLPPTDMDKLGELGKKCYDFLHTVTEKMGASVEIRIKEEEGQMRVQMLGDTLGILIGRRGDTLDALQYLTSLYVNRGREDYTRVSLDTEHYRAKREDALCKLAVRMAAKAKKTGRRVVLEPMNPYERRILHSALQNDEAVTTHSEGEEPYRRVIITLK